jgi:hypothetical protein
MTPIEKAKEALIEAQSKIPRYIWPEVNEKIDEALIALDAEKPAEENYMVLLDAIFDAITENGIMNHPTKGMFLTSESIDACLPIIQQFAESYHQKKCAECNHEPFARFENRSGITTDVDS